MKPSVSLNGEEDEKSRQEGLGRFFHLFPKSFACEKTGTPEQFTRIPIAGENLRGGSRTIPRKRIAVADSVATILVASEEESVRQALCDLLSGYHIDTLAVASIDAARTSLALRRIEVVLSAVSLDGGTYRDLLSVVKEKAPGVPLIVVSTPGSPDEYRDYLASVNSGAFDFVCHPYQKAELERILRLALLSYAQSAQSSAAIAS